MSSSNRFHGSPRLRATDPPGPDACGVCHAHAPCQPSVRMISDSDGSALRAAGGLPQARDGFFSAPTSAAAAIMPDNSCFLAHGGGFDDKPASLLPPVLAGLAAPCCTNSLRVI